MTDFVGLEETFDGLPTMCDMIVEIKSIQFTHLSLFHLVETSWRKESNSGEFTFLYMPHLAQEARLMMDNFMPSF